MDVPLPATASGPAIDSPSDLSYSSGPSCTSTRSTSPDSASARAFSYNSFPLADLRVTAANIEHISPALLSQPSAMDKNSFQSVNDRRNKLVGEQLIGNQFQYVKQQHQQQSVSPELQVVRTGIQASPGHHRSLTSANWRVQTTDDIAPLQPHVMYNPMEASAAHHLQHSSSVRAATFRNPRIDHLPRLQYAAGSISYPNLGPLSDAQLDGSFAYCYDRGNGQYTRLIPADMLPPLQNIQALQLGCVGMVVVPQPRGLPPNGHSSNTEPVVVRASEQRSPTTPTSPKDTIQSRIDNIVAATPSTPTHLQNTAPPGQRRPKIYCDKWVHEGVCAFTQQGCKYKHEMPSDKITQHQLGLFHGYPQWWKKHQADLARQREAPSPDSPKTFDQQHDSDHAVLNDGRYFVRANNSTAGNGGTRGGGLGLNSDAGGQLTWRHGVEYGDPQIRRPPSSIGRATISRGPGGTMRNSIVPNSSDNNLSPCPVSYGSPFGPIARPGRSAAGGAISTESTRGPSTEQPTTESYAMSQGMRRSPPDVVSVSAASILPTSNPYASLDCINGGGDEDASEGLASLHMTIDDGIIPSFGHMPRCSYEKPIVSFILPASLGYSFRPILRPRVISALLAELAYTHTLRLSADGTGMQTILSNRFWTEAYEPIVLPDHAPRNGKVLLSNDEIKREKSPYYELVGKA
ncbi:putative chromatin remodeling complex subunit protein [Rosellinia necatrix]|uniref:Putative chromatin remodeling complex subunit protein n=1 Tax=Rosellinia necatrix TaxID=77044 RepID=A0A1S7UNH9_ROSNE|nr:putative chromatin remodeling complex subunit protein [Rosellinia necatrix]